jgi:hypothetical protein
LCFGKSNFAVVAFIATSGCQMLELQGMNWSGFYSRASTAMVDPKAEQKGSKGIVGSWQNRWLRSPGLDQ